MAVAAADLQIRPSLGRSGGGATFVYGTDTSIGGAMADAVIRQGNAQQRLNNLWDNVTGDETLATRASDYVDYRIIYAYNAAAQTAFDFKVYIPNYSGTSKPINYWGEDPGNSYDPPGDKGWVEMGISNANGAGSVPAILPDETTAPAVNPAPVWMQPTESAPLSLGDLAATTGHPIFLRRTVPRGASAFDAAEFDIRVHADTGQ